MRFTRFILSAVILLSVASASCGGQKAENAAQAQAASEGDGSEAAEAQEYVDDPDDLLYLSKTIDIDGKKFGFMYVDSLDAGVLAYDLKPIIYDPTLSIDSLSPTLYRFDHLGGSAVFSLADTASFAAMREFNAPLKGFSRYSKITYMHQPGEAHSLIRLSYTVDYPVSGPSLTPGLSKWIVYASERMAEEAADETPATFYTGFSPRGYSSRGALGPKRLDELNDRLAKKYYGIARGYYEEPPYPSILYQTADMRSRVANGRFVTFRIYVESYFGGAHSMYNEYLVSYDIMNDKPVNNAYLFLPGTEKEVKRRLCKAISEDEKIRQNKEPMTPEEVEAWLDGNELMEQPYPQAGLLDDGLIFSYQPYELDCFAAGCYHIKVPYNDIQDLLTPRAMALIGR